MNTYAVEAPNGQILTRKSKHNYKWAVLVKFQNDDRWLASFHSTMDAATKDATKCHRIDITKGGFEEVIIRAVRMAA